MRAKRLTIRQRLVRALSKRYKVLRVTHPRKVYRYTGLFGPWKTWETHLDGYWRSSGGSREDQRQNRLDSIQSDATSLLADMREMQRQGFKVTFPACAATCR